MSQQQGNWSGHPVCCYRLQHNNAVSQHLSSFMARLKKVFSQEFGEYLLAWHTNSVRLKAEVGLFEGFSRMTCYFLFSCLWAQNACRLFTVTCSCGCFFFLRVSSKHFLWPPPHPSPTGSARATTLLQLLLLLLVLFFLYFLFCFEASLNAAIFNNSILK